MSAARDSINRYFEFSLFLMLAMGFLTLAGTGKMDIFTIALMGGALAVRTILFWRDSSFRLTSQAVFRLTLGYVPFYFVDLLVLLRSYESPLERLLLATIHLIFFTATLKMFSAERPRDYLFLAALAFALMLASATMTVHLSFLIYFAFFLFLSIATFTSFEIKRARDRVTGSDASSLPASAEAKLGSALTGTAVLICVGTVFLATILFFVIPRGRSGYFSSLAGPSERITGFSDNVELGQIGQIKHSSMVVMHIQAAGLSPFDQIKWRGIGLATFDGKRWFNRNSLIVAIPGAGNFRFHRNLSHPGQRPSVLRYTVTLQPVSSDAIFLAPQPLELTGAFRSLWQDETGSVYMPARLASFVRYFAISDIAIPKPDLLRADSGEAPSEIQQTYLELPPTDDRVKQLARDITKDQPSNYDKAKAMETYLQKNFGYTLDLPASMPEDPIAYFLFTSRKGHCEFFASAMAIMLRTVGIPSRVVNGFLQGSYNEISGNYTVRASDAHTWVEVYFPSYGWVTFDPTPLAGRGAQAAMFGRLSMYMDAFQSLWEEWIINYDFLHQITLARQLEGTSRQIANGSQFFLRTFYQRLVVWVAQATEWIMERRVLALAVLALAVGTMWILLLRATFSRWMRERGVMSRARKGTARPEDATQVYLRLLRILSRRGLRKSLAQTPSEFAASLPEPAGMLVRDFTDLYLQARFGRFPQLLPRLNALLEEIRGGSARVDHR